MSKCARHLTATPNGDIDVRAYERPLLPILIASLLAWGLVGLVVWGVFLVTP